MILCFYSHVAIHRMSSAEQKLRQTDNEKVPSARTRYAEQVLPHTGMTLDSILNVFKLTPIVLCLGESEPRRDLIHGRSAYEIHQSTVSAA